MQPFQQRVVTERDELAKKLDALGNFIEGESFKTLPVEHRILLHKQYEYMSSYLEVLEKRIASFTL